jgi:catalase
MKSRIGPLSLAARGLYWLLAGMILAMLFIRRQWMQARWRWRLLVTLADPAEPPHDATKPRPDKRSTMDGGPRVRTRSAPPQNRPGRDIHYKPLVLPHGIEVSCDPLRLGRAANYADSYLRHSSAEAHLPGTTGTPTQPKPEIKP